MNFTRLDFEQARMKHLQFKMQLQSILNGAAIDPAPVLSEYKCELGKWIYEHALQYFSYIPEVQQLEQVHAEIHACARKLINWYETGKVALAQEGLTEIEAIAEKVVFLLSRIEAQIMGYRNEAVFNESRFRESLQQAPVGIAIFRGKDMVIEMANAMYLTLITRPLKKVLGRSLYDVLPEVTDTVKPMLDEVWDTGIPRYGNEFPVTLYRNGLPEKVYFNFVYQPLKNAVGEIDGVMVAATDVTIAVAAKHDLVESENQFRNLVTQSPIAMAIFKGRDMVIDMANDAMLKHMWRRTAEEVIGKRVLDAFPELVGQKFPELLIQVYESGVSHKEKEAVAYVESHDGMKKFYLDFEYRPLFDLEKNVYAIMATVYDVTERKETEMALRLSEEKFRVLGETLPQLIWTTDADGVMNYASHSYSDYTGIEMAELVAGGWFNAIHAEDMKKNMATWQKAKETGESYQIEHRMRKEDGSYRWFLTRAVAQKDADGHVKMWVGSSTDIHEGKLFIDQLEAEVAERTRALQRSNDELRNSNEELAQFAYVASHDLQEPLRKIQTFASRLLETENHISDKGRDYFNRMQAAAQRMRQLIEDLLTFSRASNNGEQLFEYVDLTHVLQRVKEQLGDQIEKKGARVEYDLLPVLSVIPYQVEQLFMNLLNNALKFGRQGVKPEIKVKMEDHVYTVVGGIPYHRITVSDNGIGFDPQFSERIFQVFQRLHVKNQFEGTGIGLAICRKIMDNHGGFIEAEGKPDEGAVFTLLFPVV
jgi:PAS domain S-box-containing protein